MITAAEWDRVKSEYAFVRNASDFEMSSECREHSDWQRVYKQGCDSKYGTVNPMLDNILTTKKLAKQASDQRKLGGA